MNAGAAQALFIVGSSVFVAAGGGHALLALVDVLRPTAFAPIDRSVQSDMEGTGMRFRRPFPGDESRPSMWRFWLGFNISHGLGACAFGLLCLLIGAYDFKLVERVDAIRPLTIAVAAAYFAIALRFWFNAVAIMTGVATASFVAAAVLSA